MKNNREQIEKNDLNERKREVINACLDCFIKKGFFSTTSRDLSDSLKLQSGGIYYYFRTKDDIVTACAEVATLRLEMNLIFPALADIEHPDEFIDRLVSRADEMAPTMKFLATICATEKYKDSLKSVLDRLSKRYKIYAERFAKKIKCDVSDVETFLYICITSITNYMIFEETSYVFPQLEMVREEFKKLLKKRNEGEKIG